MGIHLYSVFNPIPVFLIKYYFFSKYTNNKSKRMNLKHHFLCFFLLMLSTTDACTCGIRELSNKEECDKEFQERCETNRENNVDEDLLKEHGCHRLRQNSDIQYMRANAIASFKDLIKPRKSALSAKARYEAKVNIKADNIKADNINADNIKADNIKADNIKVDNIKADAQNNARSNTKINAN